MLAISSAALGFSSSGPQPDPEPTGKQPNIIYILADDLGWNNVGYHAKESGSAPFKNINYGLDGKAGEVAADGTRYWTPTIDRLATEEGARMDRYYSFKFCGPSRSALQSGRNPLHVNVINDPMPATEPLDPVSGFSGMARDMTGMAEHMKAAGYKTVFSGKWHVGIATEKHIPKGRGYDYNLGYLDGVNNFWNHMMGEDGGYSVPVGSDTSPNEGWSLIKTEYPGTDLKVDKQFISLWESTPDHHGPAFDRSNALHCDQFRQEGCKYEDELFGEYTLDHINSADPDTPLFLVHAFHIAHNPLEVPSEWLAKFPPEDFNDDGHVSPECFRCEPGGSRFPCSKDSDDYPDVREFKDAARTIRGDCSGDDQRRVYTAMVAYMDDMIRRIEMALKEKGMWENTLIVFSSDNGGPTYRNGEPGANNYPLRGGKRSAFEGGMRTVGFLSGGYLPSKQYKKTLEGFIAIEDWYGTFLSMAGGDPAGCLDTLDVLDLHSCRDAFDPSAAAAGLPPIDSVNVWPYISGKVDKSPRHEIVIAAGRHSSTDVSGMRGGVPYVQGLITDDGWKLIVGPTVTWERSAKQFPNKEWHYLRADGTPYSGEIGQSWDCGDIIAPLNLIQNNWSAHTDDCKAFVNEKNGMFMHIFADKAPFFPGCFFNIFDDPKELTTYAADPQKAVECAQGLQTGQDMSACAGIMEGRARTVKMRKRMLALDKTTGAWLRFISPLKAAETSNMCGGKAIEPLYRPKLWYQSDTLVTNEDIKHDERAAGEKAASIDNGWCNYIGPFIRADDKRFEPANKAEWLKASDPALVKYCKDATGDIGAHCALNGLK